MSTHSYFGIQLTVTTKVNLFTALAAVDNLVPSAVRELTIQNDSASSNIVFIGDANISSSRYGVELAANGTFKQYGQGSDLISVPVSAIYLLSAGTSKVNVEGWTG